MHGLDFSNATYDATSIQMKKQNIPKSLSYASFTPNVFL